MFRPLQIFAALFFMLFAAPHAYAAPDARRFTVTVEGHGPDVILIPGLASSAAVWDATVVRLKADHRVHVIQVAGYAGAPAGGNGEGPVVAPLAEAISTYISEHQLRAPAVIGHSLGGATALMIAARHPDLIGRVMAVDALPFFSLLFNPSATVESVRPQADAMRDMLLAQTPEQAQAAGAAMIARLVNNEAARPAAIAWSNTSDRAVVARSMHELMTADLRPELARITAPVTVVYAYDPRYGMPSETIDGIFRSAYAGTPHVEFVRVDNSFHFIMLDQPAAFADAVARFLAGQ